MSAQDRPPASRFERVERKLDAMTRGGLGGAFSAQPVRQRPDPMRPLPAAGGGASVYVQDDEPAGVPTGTLWYDTDATC